MEFNVSESRNPQIPLCSFIPIYPPRFKKKLLDRIVYISFKFGITALWRDRLRVIMSCHSTNEQWVLPIVKSNWLQG